MNGTGPTLKPDDEDECFPPCVPDDVFPETAPFLEKDGGGCITAWAMLGAEKEREGPGRCGEAPGAA